jgi:hydroxyacylglutathione hydrolase
MVTQDFDTWLESLTFDFWGTGQHKMTAAQLSEKWRNGEQAVVLDTRTPEEVQHLSLPFAVHVPIAELPRRWQEVPADVPVAVFCSSGVRSTLAYAYLRLKGLTNVRILEGNYEGLTAELVPGKLWKMIRRQ